MTKKQTVLISGGAGFLGSHLCDYYLAKGSTVVAVDNLSTGNTQNIAHIEDNTDFFFVEADIVKPLPKEVLRHKYDLVLNMASPASPPQYQRLGLETLDVGFTGTRRMLDLARSSSARFFQASTSEVYGDPDVHPQPEKYKGSVNCYGPRSMYDEAKRVAESMIWTFRAKYPDMAPNTRIGRFFNTYGPRMDPADGRVVSNLIVQALRGEPLTVYGKGEQTRSFCYVDDLIEGITRLIDSEETDPMNLGNPGEFTIMELAELVLKLTNSKSKIIFKPLPKDDPLQRKPDITYAKDSLGWKPEVPLEHGLLKTIEYFKTVI